MQLLLLTNHPPSTSFKRVHQPKRIPNYQLYAVEKWFLQRRHTTLLVVYTGNPEHIVTLDAYEPDSQQVYDDTIALLRADGARPRQTPDGVLMVTSLAHFRSDYTIVQIPGGDFNQVKDQLYANINLLRIGCSGRTALTLEDPSESTKERFISLYSLADPAPPTSVDHLPLNSSTSSLPFRNARSRESFVTTVLELVKLVQAGLVLFGMPNMPVVPHNLVFDGLLCDDTVQGIQLWTSHIGGPCVGLEPTQRTADPLFVSALLSLVLSIRNKLAYLGYNHLLPRDPFLYPYAFSLAISSFLQSFSIPALSSPPSLIPAAPPPTNFFSAAAAAAAISAASTLPVGAILTRELVQNITSAYDTKLKAENRKVRRVIKNRLVAGGVDSDGDNNNSGLEQQRRQHTLSMSGGEGPSSLAERSPSTHVGVSNTASANVGGGGTSATGTAGSSSGQILSGIASGLGLGASGEATIVPTIDLSSFVASVLRSSAGGGSISSHNPISSRRERRKKEKDRTSLSLRAGESIDLGIGGVGANSSGVGSVAGTSLGFYYERDRDAGAVGGTVRALWSGRIGDLVRMREEAEGVVAGSGLTSRSISSSLPGSNFGPGGSLGSRPSSTLHKRSRSSDATKWSSKQKQEQQERNRRQLAAGGGGVASDGDRYDGRSTEEESDVFLNPPVGNTQSFGGMWSGKVRGKLGTWATLAKRKNQSVDMGSPGLTSSSAKGKERERDVDSFTSKDRGASLSVPQSQSQSRGSSPAASPSQLSKLIIGSSTPVPPSLNQNPRRPSISRRSTTIMPPGAQSPTLPPMVFSHDVYSDDDLLSSGQVSPLSDYRPNPFNMLGRNNTTRTTLSAIGGGADFSTSNLYLGTATAGASTSASSSRINLLEYERTLERLVRQKKLPSWAARKPHHQQAQARVASWADPVSAEGELEGAEEEDQEEDDVEDVEEEGEEDQAGEEASTTGKKMRRRDKESEADDSDISRLGLGNKAKGKAKAGSKAGAVFKSRRREKARFHSLMSVMDGEGVLAEEPLGIDEEEEEGGYEDEDEMGTESDNEWWEGDLSRSRGRRRGARAFDMQRRRSFHDLETFRWVVEVLTPEQMKIDVDLCGHLLVMRRREEHIQNVLAVAGLIAKSISKTNSTLREHYKTHSNNLHDIDRASSILADIDAARLRSVKILQSTNTLQYESAQFQVDDDLWQAVRPARHKVFELREKVFGANGAAGAGASGSRRLPTGVHGAHGSFNRLQWTLDSQPRLVDHLGRTESEAEEESMFDERGSGGYRDGQPLTPASVGGELPALEEDGEGNVVEHPGIKPMWLLRFFTSWGARWSAAAATTPNIGSTTGVTSPPTNEQAIHEDGKDEKASSPKQRDELLPRSASTLVVTKPVANKEAAKELPRPASH